MAFAATNFPADGDYAVRVRAVDTAANVGRGLVAAAHRRHGTAGDDHRHVAADPALEHQRRLHVLGRPAGLDVRVRINGGPWAACTGPKNYTSLAEGSHTFDVRATDVGGNIDPSPASHTWFVDTVPPVATMDDPGQYLKGTVNLDFASTDTGGSSVASVSSSSPAGAGPGAASRRRGTRPASPTLSTTSA